MRSEIGRIGCKPGVEHCEETVPIVRCSGQPVGPAQHKAPAKARRLPERPVINLTVKLVLGPMPIERDILRAAVRHGDLSPVGRKTKFDRRTPKEPPTTRQEIVRLLRRRSGGVGLEAGQCGG